MRKWDQKLTSREQIWVSGNRIIIVLDQTLRQMPVVERNSYKTEVNYRRSVSLTFTGEEFFLSERSAEC